MKKPLISFRLLSLALRLPMPLILIGWCLAQQPESNPIANPVGKTDPKPAIPEVLQPWENWVLWKDKDAAAPRLFNNAGERISLWPSRLHITAAPKSAQFEVAVRVFAPAWLALPGNADFWPAEVRANGEPAVVVERDARPAIRLLPGVYQVTGQIPWSSTPQRLAIPPQFGLLALTMNGAEVKAPNWDGQGFLWLKRTRASEEEQREFLGSKIYRVLEDGIPMWLRTEIEISVAGKSREEDLGQALPDGWTIASVESKLPCAVEDSGRVRVQARAGKWTIRIDSFRPAPLETVSFSENQPMAQTEVLGFRARPDFRIVELRDIQAVDVSQTTFPEKWRKLPVYRWNTSEPFRIEEKMRGMGYQKPAGLHVTREFWLDDDGDLLTFRDAIAGEAQQEWRLDVSPGQSLGAARMEGEGQLITKNPIDGASGIEVRQRRIELEAVGRIEGAHSFPASGWQADVEKCEATLHLPPGWRLLALFGAEWVRGDWLTNWTLLDLFLLLVFAIAVGKLWGWIPALVALIGFGLTFHEPGAPKWVWFFLLAPLAVLRMKLTGTPRILAEVGKYLAIAALFVVLVPFMGRQIQGVLYPQLEPGGLAQRSQAYPDVGLWSISSGSGIKKMQKRSKTANLKQDVEARIQTGPAVPSWQWRDIRFGWRGPVTPSETVKLVLIPPGLQRIITVVRVIMLILLVAVLLGSNRLLPRFLRRNGSGLASSASSKKAAAVLVGILTMPTLFCGEATAQTSEIPGPEMLKELRDRLLETPDAFPRAAEIADAKLTVSSNRTLKLEAEIHAAARCAAPLPGKLPTWSPLSAIVNGAPATALLRHRDYLWVVLEPGIHQVEVEGLLPGVTEWSWTFLLQPRRVRIEAPEWTVSGIKANGVPEKEIFFSLKSPASSAEAAYDRKDFSPALSVERDFELGLLWQVRTTLKRLSSRGKAIALEIPLLPGERILSSNVTAENNQAEVRLGANVDELSWESELPQSESIELLAPEEKPWVERWKLDASPVWNVAFEGLSPVYESNAESLSPVWRPWPGESAKLLLSKPEAIPGATMTVRAVDHQTRIGTRQRVSQLRLNLQASLAQDFVLDLDPAADVTSLKIGDARNTKGVSQPVRRDESRVIIPVRPGEQIIDLEWRIHRPIARKETADRLAFPVESSNISSSISLPADRWVLWTSGPLLGPAVRLWSIVLLALVVAFVLGRLRSSPLRGGEWGLLVLGLTQVHPVAALFVICWFFLVAWRGSDTGTGLNPNSFNLLQLAIVFAALPVIVTILFAVHRGLLGVPEMMVEGNQSSYRNLQWFAQRTESVLPEASVVSVSIWYYRFLMLAWALWLAISAIRWVRWAWEQFTRQTIWKSSPPRIAPPASRGKKTTEN